MKGLPRRMLDMMCLDSNGRNTVHELHDAPARVSAPPSFSRDSARFSGGSARDLEARHIVDPAVVVIVVPEHDIDGLTGLCVVPLDRLDVLGRGVGR